MFDGIFLYRLKDEFNNLKTGRISKINESGDTDFIITIRSQRNNYNLMVSFSSEFSRIHYTNRIYDNTLSPKSFTMLFITNPGSSSSLPKINHGKISNQKCPREPIAEFGGLTL